MTVLKTVECVLCMALCILFVIVCSGAWWLFNSACYAVVIYALFSLVVILFDVDGVFWQQAVEAVGLSVLILYLLFFVCC